MMQNKVRPEIAVIGSKGLHSEYGGVEKVVYQITHALRDRYHFTVFGNSGYKNDEYLDTDQISAIYLRLPRIKLSGAWLLAFFATLIALRRRAELYYFHACGPGFFTFLARLGGGKVVWHFHGSDYRRSLAAITDETLLSRPLKVFKQYVRYFFLKAGEMVAVYSSHRVFVLGRSNYKTLCEMYPAARPKLVAATNFVSLEEEERPELLEDYGLISGSYLLSASRLVPEKRIDLLIRVFRRIALEFPGLHLVIIGEGEERSRLQALAGDEEKIVFLGAQPHRNMYTFYRGARLFCLFSTIEGQPLSILEAMSCGCPVLASDIPEIAEFGSEHLFFFHHNDEDHCQSVLREILTHPDRARNMATRAELMVRQTFSPETATGTLNSVFESLLVRE